MKHIKIDVTNVSILFCMFMLIFGSRFTTKISPTKQNTPYTLPNEDVAKRTKASNKN